MQFHGTFYTPIEVVKWKWMTPAKNKANKLRKRAWFWSLQLFHRLKGQHCQGSLLSVKGANLRVKIKTFCHFKCWCDRHLGNRISYLPNDSQLMNGKIHLKNLSAWTFFPPSYRLFNSQLLFAFCSHSYTRCQIPREHVWFFPYMSWN